MKIKKWEIIPPAYGQRQMTAPSLVIENDKGEFWIRGLYNYGVDDFDQNAWVKIELPETE